MQMVNRRTQVNRSKQPRETLLTCLAATRCNAGAVFHTHSVWSGPFFLNITFRSHSNRRLRKCSKDWKELRHKSVCWIPIFDNTEDIAELSSRVSKYLDANPEHENGCWGYLIRQHGLYTWGRILTPPMRHMEVIEFLLECIGRKTKL